MFDDLVNEVAPKLVEADGLVVGTPVYYGSANATPIAFLDRLFYSTGSVDKTMKVGCAVAVARRGGIEATWDEVNKYFGISGMPIASGQYWNGVYGREKGEAAQDVEGLQQMRTLARNMAVSHARHRARERSRRSAAQGVCREDGLHPVGEDEARHRRRVGFVLYPSRLCSSRSRCWKGTRRAR